MSARGPRRSALEALELRAEPCDLSLCLLATSGLLLAASGLLFALSNSMVIHALGTGASQQPTGTWTFTPETGFTVNGAASAAFSGFTKPAMFVCVLDQSAKNWIVYIAN